MTHMPTIPPALTVARRLVRRGRAKPWISPWPADDDCPLVLVSFSTTFQNQAGAVQRVVDAISHLPIRAIVTLGPNLSSQDIQPCPQNVHLCRSAPHGSIMPHAAAVITHGGHGTLMRALVNRVPVLCLSMGRDQNDNAARLIFHGAGLSLSPDASADEIKDALRRILADPRFAASARRLGDAVAAEAESSMVATELIQLAQQPRGTKRSTEASQAA